MNKIKYVITSGAASVAMALGVALPVAAHQVAICDGGDFANNDCSNVYIDESVNRSRNLGDGSAIIRSEVFQEQSTTASSTQQNFGGDTSGTGVGGDGTATSSTDGFGGDSEASARGGSGTGIAINEQRNTSTTSAHGLQIGGVFFSSN